MSLPMMFGCAWVLCATVVAVLPMRNQYAPGLILLVLAPPLLVWIAVAHGLWIFCIGVFAFVSMFRNPLRYLWRRARGDRPEIPV